MKKQLIVIIGPTGIGKTALSILLAKHFECEIISADSRQFFREMSIGTAVPSREELASVPHYFIHNKSIFERYTVGDFEKEASEKLKELFIDNDFAVLVGGSGLYINAVLNGLDNFPEIDISIRSKLTSEYKEFGITFLQKQLKELDPEYFHKIETENPQTLQNPHRMMRFVEVSKTGSPYSSFLKKNKKKHGFNPIIIGLRAERATVYERINLRVENMIAQGLINEAEKLYPHKELDVLKTVGYSELFRCFDGEIPMDFAIEEIKKNTRHFSKRQLTWFGKTENTTWFDFQDNFQNILEHIKKNL